MNFYLKRLIRSVLTFFAVITITFVLMKTLPGDPLSPEKPLPPQVREQLIKQFKFDRPIVVQYGYFLKNALQGDFGKSFVHRNINVSDIIINGFPISFFLGFMALSISIIMGTLFGTLATLHQNRFLDYLITTFSSIGVSIPTFVSASILQYFFAVYLDTFPICYSAHNDESLITYLILPALSLSIIPTASIARLIRSSMTSALKSDYAKLAYAKGLNTSCVVRKHALRNSLIPVVSYLGPQMANILTGTFIVERVYAIPGLGQETFTAIIHRDYSVIMGITAFYSTILILFIFLMDVAYAYLDPRIRLVKEPS